MKIQELLSQNPTNSLINEARLAVEQELGLSFVDKNGNINQNYLTEYSKKLTSLTVLKCAEICIDDYSRQGCYGAGWRLANEMLINFEVIPKPEDKPSIFAQISKKLSDFLGR